MERPTAAPSSVLQDEEQREPASAPTAPAAPAPAPPPQRPVGRARGGRGRGGRGGGPPRRSSQLGRRFGSFGFSESARGSRRRGAGGPPDDDGPDDDASDDGDDPDDAPARNLPAGAPRSDPPWHLLDDIDVADAFRSRVRTIQDVPHFARPDWIAAKEWALEEICSAHLSQDVEMQERAHALNLFIERMLLRRTAAHGDAGRFEFAERFRLFWSYQWEPLLAAAAPPPRSPPSSPPRPRREPTHAERGEQCRRHVAQGEASIGCSRLVGAPVAPGDVLTLFLLRNGRAAEAPPLPAELRDFQPAQPLAFDRGLFTANLRSAPRGKGADRSGSRYEHLKLLLTQEEAAAKLTRVAEYMALAQLPPRAAAAYAIGGMTALLKEDVPHRKVRGIVTGSSLRRLVARTLVQQEQETIAAACAPYQFALGTRAGTDALALLLRLLTELDDERVILQLDGLGAFDNIRREAMLRKLMEVSPTLVPFVRQFYGGPSTYY